MEIVLKSPYKSLTIPSNRTLAEFILERAAVYGDRIAATEPHTGRQFTYAELIDRVKRAASAFSRRGMKKGDIVLIISPNDINYGVAFLALASLGVILTTTDPSSTARELKLQLLDAEASYVITAAALSDKTKDVTEKFISIKEVFCFGHVEGMTSFLTLLSEDVDEHVWDDVDLDSDDMIILPYSSGTTGMPKGVMLSHKNFISHILTSCYEEVAIFALTGNRNYVLFNPLYHLHGMGIIFLPALYTGNNLIYMPKFDLEQYLNHVQKYKVQVLVIVPPIAVLLAKHPIVDRYDFSEVHTVFCASAPLGKQLAEDVMARLGIRNVRQGYGMTEIMEATISPVDGWKHGSAGVLLPNFEGKVVDINTGQALGANAKGEIWIKGPTAMKGYFKRADATSITLDKDGWIHSGDIGYYDEDRHLFVVDRLKELIKYKGHQVAPAELENLLLTHPGVDDAAVIGLPDKMAGELPKAFVVRKEGFGVSSEDIESFVQENAARPKWLRGGVEFVDVIPKTSTGKILRRVLRNRIAQSKL